ncbi:hypothetical protein [Paenibacillus taichungensis]|uniref:hypothetical protein n=1 Tax=Paenibacillus taichungensis TaxID=484184 RepID=UPI0039A721D1
MLMVKGYSLIETQTSAFDGKALYRCEEDIQQIDVKISMNVFGNLRQLCFLFDKFECCIP